MDMICHAIESLTIIMAAHTLTKGEQSPQAHKHTQINILRFLFGTQTHTDKHIKVPVRV